MLHMKASRKILNFSRECDSTAFLGNLFQCTVILKELISHVLIGSIFLYCGLCSLPLVLLLGTTGKSPIHLTPTVQIFINLVRSTLSLLSFTRYHYP